MANYTQPNTIQGGTYGVVRCKLTHADLTAAATNEVLTWAALVTAHPTGAENIPANSRVVGAGVNILVDFSGGSSSSVTIDMGDAANDDELLALVDLFTGAKAAAQLTGINGVYVPGTFEAAYVAKVDIISDVNVVALTAGEAELWIEYVSMTTDGFVTT